MAERASQLLLMLFLGACTAAPVHQLLPPALQRLDVGKTKPRGWVKDEFTLQARGLSGQLPWFWSYINGSAWTGGKGAHPEQFMGYYLQGLIPLSYQIDDANLVQIRERYVSYILEHQHSTGWLGPPVLPGSDAREYWGKYDAVQALEYYAEGNVTAMPVIKAALMRHHKAFHQALSHDTPHLNTSRWGVDRYSDGLVGIQWLLDRGEGQTQGSQWIWELQQLLRARCDQLMAAVDHSWESWFASDPGFKKQSTNPFNSTNANEPTGFVHLLRHGVDIGQALKTGPLWWRVEGHESDRSNAEAALQWADVYLPRADGMYWADEEVTGHTSPSRGTETCSIVETMFSLRTAYEITGNISFMDRLELVSFNSLPAALWPDATTNVYHHSNNQIETGDGAPYAYDLYFCCSANVHQGWPKWLLSMVHLQQGAIVVSGYAPSSSTLPDGTVVAISGSYPFEDQAVINVSAAANLRLRIPCFSEGAQIKIGQRSVAAPSCAFFNVSVAAASTIEISFDNPIRVHTWKSSSLPGQDLTKNGGVEVHRGALLYALRPASLVNSSKPAAGASQPYPSSLPRGGAGWPVVSQHVVTIAPNTSWNYGIFVDSLQFERTKQPVPNMPFDAWAPPPVQIRAKAQLVPSWKAATGARGIAPLPESPLSSEADVEDLILVPYGSTNIRVSVFPQLCNSTSPNCLAP